MQSRTHPTTPKLVCTLLAVVVLFGWWQNHKGTVGGQIAPAKVLWLWLALSCFFMVPAMLMRGNALSTEGRALWRCFFIGFVVRAAIELPMLVATRAWRCEYGIAHNALMLCLVWFGARTLPSSDVVSHSFVPLSILCLLTETLNAHLFSQVAAPSEGIYFAGEGTNFAKINLITWVELCILVPYLAWWLGLHRKHIP